MKHHPCWRPGILSFHPQQQVASFADLIQKLNDFLQHRMQTLMTASDISEDRLANLITNFSDASSLLPGLEAGLDVNVIFNAVGAFEFTPEISAFDAFNCRLLHGWVCDPQDVATARALNSRSYNEVTQLITSEDLDDLHWGGSHDPSAKPGVVVPALAAPNTSPASGAAESAGAAPPAASAQRATEEPALSVGSETAVDPGVPQLSADAAAAAAAVVVVVAAVASPPIASCATASAISSPGVPGVLPVLNTDPVGPGLIATTTQTPKVDGEAGGSNVNLNADGRAQVESAPVAASPAPASLPSPSRSSAAELDRLIADRLAEKELARQFLTDTASTQ